LSQAKGFDSVAEITGSETGEADFKEIVDAITNNPPEKRRMIPLEEDEGVPSDPSWQDDTAPIITPQGTQNPEPPSSGAPFLPNSFEKILPASSLPDPTTPTPTTAGIPASISLFVSSQKV